MINLEGHVSNIVRAYRDAVKEADMDVRNETYYALEKCFKDGFSEGWIAATLWMNEREGCLSDRMFREENLNAKNSAIDDLFGPDFNFEGRKNED